MGRKNLNGAKTWLFPPYLLIISLLTSCILEVFIQPTPLLSGGHFQLLLGLLEEENFSISMRIYLPGEEFFSNLKRINLPIVEKIRCLDE